MLVENFLGTIENFLGNFYRNLGHKKLGPVHSPIVDSVKNLYTYQLRTVKGQPEVRDQGFEGQLCVRGHSGVRDEVEVTSLTLFCSSLTLFWLSVTLFWSSLIHSWPPPLSDRLLYTIIFIYVYIILWPKGLPNRNNIKVTFLMDHWSVAEISCGVTHVRKL